MTEEDRIQRSIAEHVLWCREERDRLAKEIDLYRSGALSIGKPMIGEIATQGTLTHIAFLERAIQQLDRVIAAYSPPSD